MDDPISTDKDRDLQSDTSGMLIYDDDLLIAVMVQLEDEAHSIEYLGKWNLEATFDGLPFPVAEVFENLDDAKVWIARRLDHH